ncbi:hypothetical protein ACEPAF_2140 [Sanghuangporus sanghuang]
MDDSVYIRIINDTNSRLTLDASDAAHGYWLTLPSSIEPQTSVAAQLKDSTGFYGSEGTFTYYVAPDHTNVENHLFKTYQTCPYGSANSNEIKVTNVPDPKAVFLVSWRAHSADNDWIDGGVQESGHPVYVEYTIKFNPKRFRFRVMHIDAISGHPVRNSKDQLIVGKHRLWDSNNPSSYIDDDKGSLQPNVFPYTFSSSVPSSSSLKVTIRPVDLELLGAECYIYGIVNGDKIMQSDYFFIKTENTVDVHIITPQSSDRPFSWNASVQWAMELRVPQNGVDCIQPNESRLELYWISKQLHRALSSGIPISLLRHIVPSEASGSSPSPAQLSTRNSQWNILVTRDVFGNCSKEYDVNTGAPHFGLFTQGGNFDYSLYSLHDDTGAFGSLFRTVNCYDQAAMLELFLSIGPSSSSWLLQQPFGFIKQTYLVGIPYPCNNPFYGTDTSRRMVNINDPGRSWFDNHVYNGYSKPFDRNDDGTYDACGGPHEGEENAQEFLDSSIDTDTTLYHAHGFNPGTVANIQDGYGVLTIDGQPPSPANIDLSLLPERIRELIQKPSVASSSSVSQKDWARLPEWVGTVLGENAKVLFGQIRASGTSAQASWLVAGVQDLQLKLDINVETRVDSNGDLDVERSLDAARSYLASVLQSLQRDPDEVWIQSGLDEYGESSVQYADNIAAGRAVLMSGNTIVDIRGASSSTALLPLARTLLNHTTVEGPIPRVVPFVSDYFFEVPEASRGDADHTVKGTDIEFVIHCEVNARIASASAYVADNGALLSKYEVTDVEGGNSSAVALTFITREVGSHEMALYFAEWSTMACGTKMITVDVVPDDNEGEN